VGLLLLTSAVTVYAINMHLVMDQTQSSDISQLASTVSQLTVVVEHNYKETERNATKMEENAKLLHDTQMRLERILGRIESRMDEENN
jgi:hypothetical protein